LKAPGIKRLKLKYDKPLSNFAFKFNLRRYTWARSPWCSTLTTSGPTCSRTRARTKCSGPSPTSPRGAPSSPRSRSRHGQGLTLVPISAQLELFCPLRNLT
jgi:hypothetical protein